MTYCVSFFPLPDLMSLSLLAFGLLISLSRLITSPSTPFYFRFFIFCNFLGVDCAHMECTFPARQSFIMSGSRCHLYEVRVRRSFRVAYRPTCFGKTRSTFSREFPRVRFAYESHEVLLFKFECVHFLLLIRLTRYFCKSI